MKRQATSWQKIIAIGAYLTKDLEPKESADCFFNGKELEQILHREHVKSSKHSKGPSRSPPMGTLAKISKLLLGPEQRAEAPGPPRGKWLLLSKSDAPHDPKVVTTCA